MIVKSASQQTVDQPGLTRNDISGIHFVFVFDETEAVHQLDLRDFAGVMGAEVFLDILFGHCRQGRVPIMSADRGQCPYSRVETRWLSMAAVLWQSGYPESHSIPLRGRFPR